MNKNSKISLFTEHWYCIKDLSDKEKAQILTFLFTDELPEKGEANIICKYIQKQQERIKQFSQEMSVYGKQGVIAKTLKGSLKVAKGTQAPNPNPNPNPNKKENSFIATLAQQYKTKINPLAEITNKSRLKILTRLKKYPVETLALAIDKFSGNKWRMANNNDRPLAWFFDSDDKIDQWLMLKQDNASTPQGLKCK